MFRRPLFIVLFSLLLIVGYAAEVSAADFQTTVANFMSSGFCWFCPLFAGIFAGINNITTTIATQLANVFLSLLAVGLLFWIVFYIGRAFVSMQPINVGKFFSDMYGTVGRAIVATALIISFFGIYHLLINPMLTLSMGLSDQIMNAGGFAGQVQQATQTFASQDGGVLSTSICSFEKESTDGDVWSSMGASVRNFVKGDDNCKEKWSTTKDQAFTLETCQAMECSIRSMSASLLGNIAVGSVFITSQWDRWIWNWNWSMIVSGVVLVIGNFIIMLLFPFKMIDAIIRLGFVSALAPLFIVLWVFPATRGYTQKAWQMLIGSCMTFVFLAVIIILIVSILSYGLPTGSDLDRFLTYLSNGKAKEASKFVELSGSKFFVMIAVCFIGYKVLGTAESFASAFGGVMPQIGVGAALQGKAEEYAGKATAPVRKAVGWTASKVGGAALAVMSAPFRVAGRAISNVWHGGRTDDERMDAAFENAEKMKNDTISFTGVDGEKVKAKKGDNGRLKRTEVTGKDGKTKVYDGQGNLIGTRKNDKNGGYSIVDENGKVREKREKTEEGWKTTKYDANGHATNEIETKLKQVGNKVVRESIDSVTGQMTRTYSKDLEPAKIESILKNGESFAAALKEKYSLSEKGEWIKETSTTFERDVNDNIKRATEMDAAGKLTREHIMGYNGVQTTEFDDFGAPEKTYRNIRGKKIGEEEFSSF